MTDSTPVRTSVGVVGAGTMGAGIAQVAAWAGHPVILYDVADGPLAKGLAAIAGALRKGAEQGRHSLEDAEAAIGRVRTSTLLAEFGPCELVIEAAPEDLELKRRLFAEIAAEVGPAAILASNTSTLSIASIARGLPNPERICGLHFFNPAPRMPLVEVIQGATTSAETVQAVAELARSWGKTPVQAADTPGFIVNRVARPYYGEALRLLGDGVADVATIDRLLRDAGFPMGPFELMDLIGIDVNFAAAQSVYEGYFQEPRFRPHPIQREMVESGRLGRKTGEGYYRYDERGNPLPIASTLAPSDPAPATIDPPRRVAVVGEDGAASNGELVRRLEGAGIATIGWPVDEESASDWESFLRHADLAIDLEVAGGEAKARSTRMLDERLRPEALILTNVQASSATDVAATSQHPERVVGFSLLPPWSTRSTVECARAGQSSDPAAATAAALWRAIGLEPVWLADSVGLVSARVVASLANEAFFAVQEGVASAAAVDQAMKLGTRYPRGPIEWAEAVGLVEVLATLAALAADIDPTRYRPATLLRRRAGHRGG